MKIHGSFAALLLIVVALASGCASLPMADPAQDTAAKTFSVSPGKSKIYVYRNEGFGAAITMDVFLNGRPLGRTVSKTYLVAEVDPGAYRLMGKAENEDSLDLMTAPGRVYYVWQEVKMGGLYGRNKLQQVDDATGRAGVMECKLAAQN
jgi:hypothetical protein